MTQPDHESSLDLLARELDARADQDDAFWQRQRQDIRRSLRQEPEPNGRSVRHLAWTFGGLAASAALMLLFLAPRIFVPDGERSLQLTVDSANDDSAIESGIESEIDAETAELLRSVETTLSADVAPSLAAADLLLAQLEAEFTDALANPTRSDPDP